MMGPTDESFVDPRARITFHGYLPYASREVQLEVQTADEEFFPLGLTRSAAVPTDHFWGGTYYAWELRQAIPSAYWRRSRGQGEYVKVRAQLLRARTPDDLTQREPETPLYTFEADYDACAVNHGSTSAREFVRDCASPESPVVTLYSRDYCPDHYGPREPETTLTVDADGRLTAGATIHSRVRHASVTLNGRSVDCRPTALLPRGTELTCSGTLEDLGFASRCEYDIWRAYAPRATWTINFIQTADESRLFPHCATRVARFNIAPVARPAACEDACNPLAESADCAAHESCYIVGRSGQTACIPPGTGDLGTACESPLQCQPGMVCVGLFEPTCRRLCAIGTSNRSCPRCIATAQTPPGIGICQ